VDGVLPDPSIAKFPGAIIRNLDAVTELIVVNLYGVLF
jgi:hypothetical protein